MDGQRFDRIAVAWSRKASRRRVIAGLGAAVFGAIRLRASSAQEGIQFCGGLIGAACPPGMVCVDDPYDGCDPLNGGADCPGVCVAMEMNPCAAITCEAGSTCCPRNGGACLPMGIECDEGQAAGGEACGSNICGPGEYCCNPSCGVCKPIGEGCTREYCLPDPGSGEVKTGEPCGPTVCAEGEVCCNESCGICTPPDGFCTQQYCF